MPNDVKITFTAENAALKTGLTEGSNAAQAAAAQIGAGFQQMNGSITSSVTSSVSSLNSLTSTLGKVAGMLGVAFGVREIFNLVEDMAKLAARVETLGVVVNVVGENAGYTKEQMKGFVDQVKEMGITTQAAQSSVIKIAQAQVDLAQSAKLARIAQDAAVIGNINSSEAFERMINGIRAGEPEILRTIGIGVNFEQQYQKVARQLNKSAEELTNKEKAQARANAVIEAGVRIEGAYEAAMGTTGKQLLSMSRYAEEAKLKLGEIFAPALGVIVTILTDSLKGLNKQLTDMSRSGETTAWATNLANSIRDVVALTASVGMLLDGIGVTLTHIADLGSLGTSDSIKAWNKMFMERYKDGERFLEKLGDQAIAQAAAAANPAVAAPRAKQAEDEVIQPKNRMDKWKNQLEQMQQTENAFFGFSLDRERSFWEGKLRQAKAGSEEYRSVQHEIFEILKKSLKESEEATLERANYQMGIETKALHSQLEHLKTIQNDEKAAWADRVNAADVALTTIANSYGKDSDEYRKAIQDKKKIAEEESKALIDAANRQLEADIKAVEEAGKLKEGEIKNKADLGIITRAQELAAQKELNDQIYAQEKELFAQRVELWREYPQKYDEAMEKLRELNANNAQKTQQINKQVSLDTKQKFEKITDPIKSAISTSVMGIIQGTTTLKQAMANLAQSILLSFINAFIQMGIQWVMTQLMMALFGKATATATAVGQIAASAAVGAAGSFAQTVATIPPPYGEILAPAIAAANYATIMSYAPLAAAARGYDVPAGIAPVTQLHPEEMVLPADLAGGIRDIIAGGTSSRGGSPTIVIQAWDSKDVARFLKGHGPAVAASLKGPARDFQFTAMRRG